MIPSLNFQLSIKAHCNAFYAFGTILNTFIEMIFNIAKYYHELFIISTFFSLVFDNIALLIFQGLFDYLLTFTMRFYSKIYYYILGSRVFPILYKFDQQKIQLWDYILRKDVFDIFPSSYCLF